MKALHINLATVALQALSAVDAVQHLKPGEKMALPTIHFSEDGNHLDISLVIRKDAAPAQTVKNGPNSTAEGR